MRASILAVGTELTVGQIINKNASWISAKLKAEGFLTTVHLVVPDERKLILEALDFCAKHSEVIFITGGLGPTSDDFTRELVSEWSQLPLVFDNDSWTSVQDRLTRRGFPVQEIQKQQCYFPQGSKILKNDQGTANGFYFKTKLHEVFGLPGPPREIEAIWNSNIQMWLENTTKSIDKHITYSWDTLGLGESQVAMMAEEAAKDSPFEIGYRVHLPYVEVKFSFFESQKAQAMIWVQKIEEALKDITILRQGQDLAAIWAEKMEKYSHIEIYDSLTGSFLLNRCLPFAKNWLSQGRLQFSSSAPQPQLMMKPKTGGLQLTLTAQDEFSAIAGYKLASGVTQFEILKTQIKSPLMQERRQQFFAEMALIFWTKSL